MINNYDIKPLALLTIFPLIFYFITFNNYFYSDDYQLIIGLHLFNKINNQYFLSFTDLFSLRSDGHFTPIMYLINNILPVNHIIFHTIILFIFLGSIYLTYFFLNLFNFDKKYCFFSTLFFSLNISLLIKPLVWNTFHSHITNYFTAIISYIFFYFLISNRKKYLNFFLFLIFGILTVFNSESGLIYYLLLPLFFYFFHNKQTRIFNYIISFIPILIFFSVVFYLSFKYEQETILENRIFNKNVTINEQISEDHSLKQKISYLRSRKSPRNLEGNFVIATDIIISSFNLGSYEYINRFFDKKNNYTLSFLIKIIFAFSVIFYIFIFLKYILIKKNLSNENFKKHLLLVLFTIIIYIFIYHRKDINTALALVFGLAFSYTYINLIKNYLFKKLFILIFLIPTCIYASTSFDEVYEMRERHYISNMYNEFISLNNDIEKLKELHYSTDFIYLFYYNNYQYYSEYLKKNYKDYSWYEFESALINDELLKQ